MVFLKLQPFIQTSVAQRPYQKLAFRYYGPYRIIARVGAVAYKLQLPDDSKIHPVVHVSQLKCMVGPDARVSPSLPSANSVLQAEHQPVAIQDNKLVHVKGELQPRLLVQWSELPPSMATWEDPVELRRRFPSTAAWGQAAAQGGENVTRVRPTPPVTGDSEEAGPAGQVE